MHAWERTQKQFGKQLLYQTKLALTVLCRYDSVILTGQLAWQDRLNALNLPFFMPSTGFFTNYTVSLEYITTIRLYLERYAVAELLTERDGAVPPKLARFYHPTCSQISSGCFRRD
jgi:hypothetical protein